MGFGGRFNVKPYVEQYERIKRWHQILNELRDSNSSEDKTDYQIDCIFAFFMNCYHLKDWLENSNLSINKQTVEDFIKNHNELQICRYLCLGSKHLLLDERRHDPSDYAYIHREFDPFAEKFGNTNPIKNIHYTVNTKFGQFNVFTLADRCVELWEIFLNQNNLL